MADPVPAGSGAAAPPGPVELLRWYLDAGVDECIGPAPVNRYRAPRAEPPPAAAPTAPAQRPARPAPAPPSAGGGDGLHRTAAAIADGCASLTELRHALEAFDGLPLKLAARSTVFADGPDQPRLMCLGEAPGQEEDRQGLPFVGASGRLLDRMLASIGLDRAEVYITNVLPWRPPANRKPTPDEVAVCLPFVIRHIELVDPPALLLLGGAAASALLARGEGINRLRGRWYSFSAARLQRPVPALATFHPAYLLRTPEAKREAWRDLLMLRQKLGA
ncbi:MAG: hypothetical protein RLZZ501_891 [Pseudomonadota bacterium]|jgi:DNA polymerase